MKILNLKTIIVSSIILVFLFCGVSFAKNITKQDYYGTWEINIGGKVTQLVLQPDANLNLEGTYKNTATNKINNLLNIKVNKAKIEFVVDWDNSGSINNADATFNGYIFQLDTNSMSGTTDVSGGSGWYAKKVGGITMEDHPDPSPAVTEDEGEEKEEGMTISVLKSEYALGETVEFMLTNNKSKTQDLHTSSYVIEYRLGNKGKEFYTSKVDPFNNLFLDAGHSKKFSWNQWDNENKTAAWKGPWRIKYVIPGLPNSPFIATFKIK